MCTFGFGVLQKLLCFTIQIVRATSTVFGSQFCSTGSKRGVLLCRVCPEVNRSFQ